MASSKFSDVPSDYVPKDDTDLYRAYNPYVAQLVRRFNKVSSNYEDILQHVWYQLVKVNILSKYDKSGGYLPKLMTAIQVCAYAGVGWEAFKKFQHRHFHGEAVTSNLSKSNSVGILAKVFKRDKGICSCTDCKRPDLSSVMVKLDSLRKDAYSTWVRVSPNSGKSTEYDYASLRQAIGFKPNQKYHWYAVRTKGTPKGKSGSIDSYRTMCFMCWNKETNQLRKSKWGLTPQRGTWSSKHTLYTREDAEAYKALVEASPRHKVRPEINAEAFFKTKSVFKLYLARAVHNIYANWCRTRDRKYKEHMPGTDAVTGKSWEDTLEDSVGPRQEDLLLLYEVSKTMARGRNGVAQSEIQESILSLAAEGFTGTEIISKLSLPKSILKTLGMLSG